MHPVAAVRPPPVRVAVFAREPEPGRVKTRLVPAIGPAAAATLHHELVDRTLSVVAATGAAAELCCTPDGTHPALTRLADRHGVPVTDQGAGDLGERMARAVARIVGDGHAAVIVGTDCPAMTPAYLHGAIAALRGDWDAVIGPAADGGYVLVGLRRAVPAVFEGMRWGGGRVFREQCRRFTDAGLAWTALPELWDLDRPDDLRRYTALQSAEMDPAP